MLRLVKKLAAVVIAIWLPLFSGNALAVSVAMQATDSDCHSAVVQQHDHGLHHHGPAAHDVQSSSDQGQSAGQLDSQNFDNDCGICHLACCGYMATVSIRVAEAQPFTQSYVSSSTQFESVALTPLDPPPLGLA